MSNTSEVVILGLETSCDETSASLVDYNSARGASILSNIVFDQIADHRAYGGVVPEIAARRHIDKLIPSIELALAQADKSLADVDAIAATSGPGLIGALFVGFNTGKAISMAQRCDFLGINHLEGHLLSPRLSQSVDFPYLALLVSGGHSQIILVKALGDYRVLGSTLDDALGEAFDKCAKLLGLGYPGGPIIEERASRGDPYRVNFPVPMSKDRSARMSFSGLKTSFRLEVEGMIASNGHLLDGDINDLCASFQRAAFASVRARVLNALDGLDDELRRQLSSLAIVGGVAANRCLYGLMKDLCEEQGLGIACPPLELCGDNAAMIAYAGLEHFLLGHRSALGSRSRARWKLDEPEWSHK